MHPRTRDRLRQFGLELPGDIRAIEPVGYLDMVMLERHAAVIATDSGGVQKEAFFLGVPCVVLREETEWVELVEAGAATLVGSDAAGISRMINRCFGQTVAAAGGFFGVGTAGREIALALC
jgi:UDP-GlcNAc3NAcA epimerase